MCCLYIAAKKPIIVLLFTAGPVNISDAKNNTNVGAILMCFYPGQGTGDALRQVLAVAAGGTVVSPAARLPYTWPASLVQVDYFQYLPVDLFNCMSWTGFYEGVISHVINYDG